MEDKNSTVAASSVTISVIITDTDQPSEIQQQESKSVSFGGNNAVAVPWAEHNLKACTQRTLQSPSESRNYSNSDFRDFYNYCVQGLCSESIFRQFLVHSVGFIKVAYKGSCGERHSIHNDN